MFRSPDSCLVQVERGRGQSQRASCPKVTMWRPDRIRGSPGLAARKSRAMQIRQSRMSRHVPARWPVNDATLSRKAVPKIGGKPARPACEESAVSHSFQSSENSPYGFHVRQAAERLFKARITLQRATCPLSHDLAPLRTCWTILAPVGMSPVGRRERSQRTRILRAAGRTVIGVSRVSVSPESDADSGASLVGVRVRFARLASDDVLQFV